MKNSFILLLCLFVLSCHTKTGNLRQYLNLDGTWQFALDTADAGIAQKWFAGDLFDSIRLPGTTDLAGKGFPNHDTTTLHLNRVYTYEGVTWYRKKVTIPEAFRNRHVVLSLERTKPSKVWIDTTFIGGSFLLQSPQQFDASAYLTPGEHYITIRIDNSLKHTPYGNVHIFSDDTQTNWNGIIGSIFLEASAATRISDLRVYPDIEKQSIGIRLEIENPGKISDVSIGMIVEKTMDGKTTRLKTQKITRAFEPEMKLEYVLDKNCSLWDDYRQPLYHLTVLVSAGEDRDSKTVTFGMREFSTRGPRFTINGRTVFLRGKHDACVFPLSGHAPTDIESWARAFRIAKSYGINHYRFHSYCPPEAAFEAADRTGMFLQAELPFWGGLESDTVAAMLLDEGIAMLKSYGNHPSFVMFSHGNEIWSGHDRVEKNILALKKYDSRPLYTMGSNNNIGYVEPRDCSDFFIGARTPYAYDTVLTHTRLSQAFCDSKDGGILNTQMPSADIRFSYAVSHINMPVIGHETGQYQIFPDYREIEKYTGVLRARNLEIFRDRLIKSGMMDQNIDFQKASGAWSALCYKAEMEAAIHTPGFGGFQLLDLQDFPGQGTALVGILDAFMDSKQVITPEAWLQSCNDVVLLLEFPKYCWTNAETFRAEVMVANYSEKVLHTVLNWEIRDRQGKVFQAGKLPDLTIINGGVQPAGKLSVDLAPVKEAEKLTVIISTGDGRYVNSYPLWVYPHAPAAPDIGDILVTHRLTRTILTALQQGASVLLFPLAEDVAGKSVPGLFPPDFWNYGMFKGISERNGKPVSPGTLGILTDPSHPIFNSFPTDMHTNWQWFSIIKAGNAMILDAAPEGYRPVVQVIDNFERNHKLGLVFELKAGSGKLLVCMSPLDQIMQRPEALQLYQSIVRYMQSGAFNPEYTISQDELHRLFVQ